MTDDERRILIHYYDLKVAQLTVVNAAKRPRIEGQMTVWSDDDTKARRAT